MKKNHLIAALAVLAFAAFPAFGQTRPNPAPATPPAGTQTGPIPESKIALIYSELFQDPKTGLAKFNTLITTLNREFQPRQTELTQLQTQIQTLEEDIRKTQAAASVVDPRSIQTKMDQLETKKKEAQRKAEDAEAAYKRRYDEIFGPFQVEIGRALEAYAKQRGINVIIDGSRVPVLYVSDNIDITRAFINDFNSKNPATASVTPPQ